MFGIIAVSQFFPNIIITKKHVKLEWNGLTVQSSTSSSSLYFVEVILYNRIERELNHRN